MVFNLTDADWDSAEEYLADKDDGSKFDKYHRNQRTGKKIRKQAARHHSFVRIDGIIYALSNRQTFLPGIGAESLVKKGITREGRVVAIKVEFGDLKDLNSPQCQIARRQGLLVGQAVRSAPNMKITIRDDTRGTTKVLEGDNKRYTVMEWKGDSLFDVANRKWSTLFELDKDLIALRACLCVQALHQSRTLHCDLKAENLTVVFHENDDISVNAIDLDFALNMPQRGTSVIAKAKGSPGFVAPEIVSKGLYSPLSDTYALGIILLFQLDIAQRGLKEKLESYMDESLNALWARPQFVLEPIAWLEKAGIQIESPLREIFMGMFTPEYQYRADANGMIAFLCQRLKNNPDLTEGLKAEIAEISKLEDIDLNMRLQALTAKLSDTQAPSIADTTAAAEGLLFLGASGHPTQHVREPLMQEQVLSAESKSSAVAACK